MSRSLKPLKIETVYNPHNGRKTDIFFDRDSKDFFIKIDSKIFRKPTARDCKDEAVEILSKVGKRDWKPFIEISVQNPHGSNYHQPSEWMKAAIDFHFERYEMAELREDEQPKPVYGNRKYELKRPFLDPQGLKDSDYEWCNDNPERIKDRIESNAEERAQDEEVEREQITDDRVVLPYTEATWATLMELRARVMKANEQLQALADPKTAPLALKGLSIKLLEAPKKTKRLPDHES